MKVSVIIPTKDRFQDVQRCLQSLSRQERLPAEVIIVDASSNPLKVEGDFPFPIHLLRTRPGLTHQRNQGFQASHGQLILHLDDDVTLEPAYLARLLTAFEDEAVGAATGRITNLSRPGWRQPLRSALWLFNWAFQLPDLGSGRFRLSGFSTFPYLYGETRQVETLSGCNMAFRREVLQRFAFDERLAGYAYMEDDDIAYRVSRRYRCLYVPGARLAHHSAPKSRRHLRAHKRMLGCHHLYLFRKNLPQTTVHKLAFGLSIIGLLITILIVERSPAGVLGLFEGLVAAWQTRCPPQPPA